MVQRNLISLANLLILAGFILTNHLAWLGIESESALHKQLYFPLLWGIIALFSITPKPYYKWTKEALTGYLIGFAIDTYLIKFQGYEETHTSEALAVIIPLLGIGWRQFRKQTEIAVAASLISYIVKGVIWALNELFL